MTHRNEWQPKKPCACPRCYYYWLGYEKATQDQLAKNIMAEDKNVLKELSK